MLSYWNATAGSYIDRCIDADETDASLIHPTEVIEWNCLDEEDDDFSLLDIVDTECDCPTTAPTTAPPSTLVPATPLTPAPTPGPVVVEPPSFYSSSSSSSSSTPLGAAIGGSVGAAALLLIAGLIAVWRRRDGKRSEKPDGPQPGTRDAPAVSGGAGRNYPVVSKFGAGKNYPIVSEFGGANLTIV